jgi:predicted nicotinamide N-methyase
LSHLLVGLASGETIGKIELPKRLLDAFPSCKELTLLELGCGVGLTGLVAAAALGSTMTILTDLKVVIDNVTQPNVLLNSAPSTGKHPYRVMETGKRGRVMAMPLCWGDQDDEKSVANAFIACVSQPKSPRKQRGIKSEKKDISKPDIILVGDVAYQHKPGAPSHFDALVSTLLQFLGPDTLVLFGTRMRLAASADLLQLFLMHMDEVVAPPVPADEIDPSFGKFKHQITVHVLRKKMDAAQGPGA